jgi:hypothetical protein
MNAFMLLDSQGIPSQEANYHLSIRLPLPIESHAWHNVVYSNELRHG